MSLVTPLSRVLGLGSAKDGAEHWWVQRLTAVALVPLGLWFAFALAGFDGFSHAAVSGWLQLPLNSILLLLTFLTLVYHSHLGVQVVIEDYVHGKRLKLAGLLLTTFAHVAAAAAGGVSILRVAFGVVQ